MPLIRIDLREGKSAEHRRAIGDAVHLAMVETINIPELDRFQVITEHTAQGLIYDQGFLDIARTDDIIFIQITLNGGRSVQLKKDLYARIVDRLEKQLGVRPEDVLINLVEVDRANWSFGRGVAQFAPVAEHVHRPL